MKFTTPSVILAFALCGSVVHLQADTPAEFLKTVRVGRGIKVSLDMGSYVACLAMDVPDTWKGSLIFGLWNSDGSKILEFLPNEVEINQLKALIVKLAKLNYMMPLKGTTLGIHCETIEVTIRRGLYELHYEDVLQESNNYIHYKKLYQLIDAIILRNKIDLHPKDNSK